MRVGFVSFAALGVLLMTADAQAASATILDAAGQPVGSATFTQTPAGVLMDATLTLPAGSYAMHIHSAGTCESKEKSFDHCGGHFNPTGAEHGFLNPKGPHAGDMPNIHVGGGKARIEVLNPLVTLEEGKPNSLMDADGSALILHAGTDDYKSQPAGSAGDRIACGVIKAE